MVDKKKIIISKFTNFDKNYFKNDLNYSKILKLLITCSFKNGKKAKFRNFIFELNNVYLKYYNMNVKNLNKNLDYNYIVKRNLINKIKFFALKKKNFNLKVCIIKLKLKKIFNIFKKYNFILIKRKKKYQINKILLKSILKINNKKNMLMFINFFMKKRSDVIINDNFFFSYYLKYKFLFNKFKIYYLLKLKSFDLMKIKLKKNKSKFIIKKLKKKKLSVFNKNYVIKTNFENKNLPDTFKELLLSVMKMIEPSVLVKKIVRKKYIKYFSFIGRDIEIYYRLCVRWLIDLARKRYRSNFKMLGLKKTFNDCLVEELIICYLGKGSLLLLSNDYKSLKRFSNGNFSTGLDKNSLKKNEFKIF